MKTHLKLIALIFCAPVFAQTNTTVVPFGLENQAGNANDSIFFALGETQELFTGSYLASSWDTPVEITGVAFRVKGSSSVSTTIPSMTIKFSTSPVSPNLMSLNYLSNRGADESTVFQHNNVPLTARGGLAVNPFDIKFTFDRPFLFDPKAGNLLMFISVPQGFLGGPFTDAQAFPNIGSSPVGLIGGAAGPQLVPAADVTQFSFVTVPEPSVETLLLGGVIILNVCRKRKR